MTSRQDFYALSGEQAGLRKPQSMPQCMAGFPGAKPKPQEHVAVGRGRSKLENAPVYIPGMPVGRGRGRLDDKAANPVLEKALQQASLPLRTYERKEKLHQQYIPGLTPKPDQSESTISPSAAQAIRDRPKDVPPQLIQGFLDGTKNPVSAMMEFSAMSKLKTEFMECVVEHPSMVAKFACKCIVNGRAFPQGVGKTKKEAKTNSAYIAFMQLLGLDDGDATSEPAQSYTYGMSPQPVLPVAGDMKIMKEVVAMAPEPEPLEKHPVSELHEHCQNKELTLDIQVSDKPHPEGFKATVYLNDEPYTSAYAHNKKDAKKLAAESAIMIMFKENEVEEEEEAPVLSHADQMQKLSHDFLLGLIPSPANRHNWARSQAFFILKRSEIDPGKVVAFGSGHNCISSEYMTPDGRTLNDCYAVVIARRAFLKYLFKELKIYIEGNKQYCIWTDQLGSNKLKLHDMITLHLYINTAPSGDAAEYTTRNTMSIELSEEEQELVDQGAHYPTFGQNDLEGYLRVKHDKGTVLADARMCPSGEQTWQQLSNGSRLQTMSCSDKLLKWNILGVQGALLSQLVDPIFITTISVGDLFDHGNMTRAVCCRVADTITASMPEKYGLHHPFIAAVTSQYPVDLDPSNVISANWSDGDDKLELLDARVGRSIPSSPFKTGTSGASRLCKAAFLHRYREFCNMRKLASLAQVRTYCEAKEKAIAYRQAQHLFLHYLSEQFGTWMKKPADIEHFAQ